MCIMMWSRHTHTRHRLATVCCPLHQVIKDVGRTVLIVWYIQSVHPNSVHARNSAQTRGYSAMSGPRDWRNLWPKTRYVILQSHLCFIHYWWRQSEKCINYYLVILGRILCTLAQHMLNGTSGSFMLMCSSSQATVILVVCDIPKHFLSNLSILNLEQ